MEWIVISVNPQDGLGMSELSSFLNDGCRIDRANTSGDWIIYVLYKQK